MRGVHPSPALMKEQGLPTRRATLSLHRYDSASSSICLHCCLCSSASVASGLFGSPAARSIKARSLRGLLRHMSCHMTSSGAWPGYMQHRGCWSGLLVIPCLAICLEAARLCERIRLHAAETHLMSRPAESRWEQTSDGSLLSPQTYMRTKED